MSDQDLNIRVTADTRNAQSAFTGLSDKFGDFMFKAANFTVVAKQVFAILEDIYKSAKAGAELIGGDVAASYDEFDANLQAVEDSGKKLLANALLPLIKASNDSVIAREQLDEALRLGIVTQDEYNAAMVRGRDAQGNWLALSDDTNAAVGELETATTKAADAVDKLSKAELAMIDVQEGSFDKAMLTAAGIITSTLNAALATAEQNVGFLEDAFRKLGLSGFDVEMMLIDMREEQGLLTEEQADTERAMLRLAEMIDNGLIVSLDDLKGVLQDGKITWEEYRGLIKLTDETTVFLQETLDAATRDAQEMQDVLDGVSGTYTANVVINVSGADLLDAAAADLAAMQDTHQGYNPPPGGTGSGSSGGSSGPPGQNQASGGHVYDGNAYIVGEQGPELFVPDQGGTIVPNGETSKMTGGGDTTVIVMLDGEQIAANVIRRAGRDARMAHSSGAALTGR